MSDFYWLREGWTSARCAECGARIWPDGDPDWGFCYPCFSARVERKKREQR